MYLRWTNRFYIQTGSGTLFFQTARSMLLSLFKQLRLFLLFQKRRSHVYALFFKSVQSRCIFRFLLLLIVPWKIQIWREGGRGDWYWRIRNKIRVIIKMPIWLNSWLTLPTLEWHSITFSIWRPLICLFGYHLLGWKKKSILA